MSWKVYFLKRTSSVLFIALMAWPRRCHFKPRSAGKVKAFKCLASRKGTISLVKSKRVYSNLRKGSNPPKAVSLEKGTSFQNTELTRSYPDAKLPRIVNLRVPWRTYSNPEPGLKAELNSTIMATFAFRISSIKAVQSISESEPFYCRLTKTLKGVLLIL